MFCQKVIPCALVWIFAYNVQAGNINTNSCAADFGSASAVHAQFKELVGARDAFIKYGDMARSILFEREYVIEIQELALLAKEHVILVGPPGNAKSDSANLYLGNLIDGTTGKNSFFKLQMTPETTMSETHGPLNYKKLTETNEYDRIYEESIIMSRTAHIEEIFDARANALRNILGALNERSHGQGPKEKKGILQTAIATTNKYKSEVYERVGDDSPTAVFDRFAFNIYIPGDLEYINSATSLVRNARLRRPPMPQLTFQQIEKLQDLVDSVEIPEYVAQFLALLRYRFKEEIESLQQSSVKTYKEKMRNGEQAEPPFYATKYQSPRTLGKAGKILAAIVVRDWIYTGGQRPLRAGLEDIAHLEKFFTLNGSRDEYVSLELERSSNPHERAQNQAILQEREVFRRHYQSLLTEVNTNVYRMVLGEDQARMQATLTQVEKDQLIQDFTQKLVDSMAELYAQGQNVRQADFTANHIATMQIVKFYEESLRELLGNKYESTVGPAIQALQLRMRDSVEKVRRAEDDKKRAEIEKKRAEENQKLAAERRKIEATRDMAKWEKILAVGADSRFEYTIKETTEFSRRTSISLDGTTLHYLMTIQKSDGTKDYSIRANWQGLPSTVNHPVKVKLPFLGEGKANTKMYSLDENTILFVENDMRAYWYHVADKPYATFPFADSAVPHTILNYQGQPSLLIFDPKFMTGKILGASNGQSLKEIKVTSVKHNGLIISHEDFSTKVGTIFNSVNNFVVLSRDQKRLSFSTSGLNTTHFCQFDLVSGELLVHSLPPNVPLQFLNVSEDGKVLFFRKRISDVALEIHEYHMDTNTNFSHSVSIPAGYGQGTGSDYVFDSGKFALIGTKAKGFALLDLANNKFSDKTFLLDSGTNATSVFSLVIRPDGHIKFILTPGNGESYLRWLKISELGKR